MDPIDFDNATEEQRRYASTAIGAWTISALFLFGLLLAILAAMQS